MALKVFTASDLDAVAATSIGRAGEQRAQTPVYKAAMSSIFPGADQQMTASDLDTPVKRGFYLAKLLVHGVPTPGQ
jgi:hypothetical protein